jgi:hypothetical protein
MIWCAESAPNLHGRQTHDGGVMQLQGGCDVRMGGRVPGGVGLEAERATQVLIS